MRHLPPIDKLIHLENIELPTTTTTTTTTTPRSPQPPHFATKQCKNITLEVGDYLGSGGFGSVFEGRCMGRRVALKRIRNNPKNPHAVDESYVAEKGEEFYEKSRSQVADKLRNFKVEIEQTNEKIYKNVQLANVIF